MAERLQRTQILLEPRQHEALKEMARSEKRSLSEMVRILVQREMELRSQVANEVLRQRLDALERVARHREAILERRRGRPIDVDVAAEIHRMRDERDDELLARIRRQ